MCTHSHIYNVGNEDRISETCVGMHYYFNLSHNVCEDSLTPRVMTNELIFNPYASLLRYCYTYGNENQK